MLGRPASALEKQINIGFIYNKLEVRLSEILQVLTDSLSNLEIAVSKSLNNPQKLILNRDDELNLESPAKLEGQASSISYPSQLS